MKTKSTVHGMRYRNSVNFQHIQKRFKHCFKLMQIKMKFNQNWHQNLQSVLMWTTGGPGSQCKELLFF